MTLDVSRSIRLKLIGVILTTTLAALVVALFAIMAYDLRVYHTTRTTDVSTQAELIGRMSASALAFDDAKAATENLELLRLRPSVQAAAIYTASGGLFATYVRPGSSPEFRKLPDADAVRVEGQGMVLYKRIVSDKEILGTVYLRTDYEFWSRVRDYVGIAFLVIIAAMLVALFMSAQLQRIVSTPILAIAGIARDVVAQRDYSRRAEKTSDDEVGVLADSFNGMLAEIERRTGELEVSNAQLAREVSERARAEHEVLRLNAELEHRVRDRTSQLEAAVSELEAFSFSVSHDLRAPLRAIDGFSQALLEDFPEHAPEEAQRYLSRIRTSTLRMGQLIEDLLNLSRLSRGALSSTQVDVSELAGQVMADIRLHQPDRMVDVSIWDGMSAHADLRLLRAAFENLLGNAWKFTAHTQRPRIEVGVLRDGDQQTFFVRDNGAGFSMAYADKLFTPFQRLHSTNEYSGTGIGLATVQRIIHRHGGRIWADAKVGQGAAFYFTLGSEATSHPATNALHENGLQAPAASRTDGQQPKHEAGNGDEALHDA